jgi:hypothetical protein
VATGIALRWIVSGQAALSLDDKIKITTVIGGIIVGVGAVVSYVDTANREIKKAYNEKKLSECVEASDVAATLTDRPLGSQPSDAWNKAHARFEILYWGSLAMFEDSNVESAYVSFRQMLNTESKSQAAVTQLQQAALTVSHACRELVSDTWTLDLPTLKGKQQQP